MAIWYLSGNMVYFRLLWYLLVKKNLAALSTSPFLSLLSLTHVRCSNDPQSVSNRLSSETYMRGQSLKHRTQSKEYFAVYTKRNV
jgi:hypothetical protein